MNIFDFPIYIDQGFASHSSADSKNSAFKNLFIAECKYNLDILSAIDFDRLKNDDPNLHSLIKVLSYSAAENLLLQGEIIGNSAIVNLSKKIFEKIESSFKADKNEIAKNNDSLIFKIYKRIRVLKSLIELDQSCSFLKKINYKLRLKNLKDVLALIVINNK